MATISSATYKPTVKRGSKPYLYHIESATKRGTFYSVDAFRMTCTCEAGRRGRRCWHIATAISLDAWRASQRDRAAQAAVDAITPRTSFHQTAGYKGLAEAFA